MNLGNYNRQIITVFRCEENMNIIALMKSDIKTEGFS